MHMLQWVEMSITDMSATSTTSPAFTNMHGYKKHSALHMKQTKEMCTVCTLNEHMSMLIVCEWTYVNVNSLWNMHVWMITSCHSHPWHSSAQSPRGSPHDADEEVCKVCKLVMPVSLPVPSLTLWTMHTMRSKASTDTITLVGPQSLLGSRVHGLWSAKRPLKSMYRANWCRYIHW